jgi:hypothetical protein
VYIHLMTEDLNTLSTQVAREKLTFRISWEHNGTYYPAKDWTDFGCIIIGWWVSGVIKLQRGSSQEEFTFMDGPYSIAARFNRVSEEVELRPEGTEVVWMVKITEIARSLVQVVEMLRQSFASLDFRGEETIIFEKYSEILRETFPEI